MRRNPLDSDFMEEVILLIAVIIIAGTAIAGVVAVCRQVDHHYEVRKCRDFSVITGYTTKFADYNFMNYECLALSKNGKWIPYDRLREID